LFIDVEASGLHAYSYPIEIGWCGPDLASGSFALQEGVKQAFPHPHRAAADARRAAALVLCLAMPDELEAIIAAA
jgi:hypothetical protein